MNIIRDAKSIEADLGIPLSTLYGVSNSLGRHYRTVLLPKRDGGFRRLSVPDEILKRIQRAIAEKLLAGEPISRYATAYRTGASVRRNAEPHIGKEMLLKLDIAHFFDSIRYSQVKERVFLPEEYTEPVRILLTMLCYHKDALPQGAPSSPAITNIIMRSFDEAVGAWCDARGITYTRYCDDMTFSGSFRADEVTELVKARLRREGFFLNMKKKAVVPSAKRQTVTGIVVNEKVNVSSEYRRQLRRDIYYCCKYGVAEHLARTGNGTDRETYLRGLLGRLAFVLSVRPHDARALEDKRRVCALLAAEVK